MQIALALLLVEAGVLEAEVEAPPKVEPEVEDFERDLLEPDDDCVAVEVVVEVAAEPLSLQLCTP